MLHYFAFWKLQKLVPKATLCGFSRKKRGVNLTNVFFANLPTRAQFANEASIIHNILLEQMKPCFVISSRRLGERWVPSASCVRAADERHRNSVARKFIIGECFQNILPFSSRYCVCDELCSILIFGSSERRTWCNKLAGQPRATHREREEKAHARAPRFAAQWTIKGAFYSRFCRRATRCDTRALSFPSTFSTRAPVASSHLHGRDQFVLFCDHCSSPS